jgi:predicted small secreted protein
MDKKGVRMINRAFLLFILLAFVISIGGCNTVSGAAKGAAEGAKKDYEAAKKTDSLMRENLW